MAPSPIEAGALKPPRARAGAAIRSAGLVAVVVIAFYGDALRGDTSDVGLVVLFGVLSLASFLWLVVSGFFGYGGARRGDWVGLIPFLVALVVREIFTLHSVQEIEIQFAQGPVGRHSVVYPLLQLFFQPIVRDAHSFTMHMNGVLGAAASLSLYLFIRQRMKSRSAGFLCALFLAAHPLIARFAPTDGPYSLLLAAWFSGLALLTAPEPSGRSLFAGATLLGLAATTRMEGGIFLVASLLLLDLRALIEAAGRHRIVAACSLAVVGAQVAVQMSILLPLHLKGPTPISGLIPSFEWMFEDAVRPATYNAHLFMRLVWMGAIAGIIFKRYRLGLLGYLAMLVVLAPVAHSACVAVSLHRMIPACAVQAMVAGIGAYSLVGWIPQTSRWRWFAVVPGTLAAFYILIEQGIELTKPYVFTEEYELVRGELAPNGKVATACPLMTFNTIGGADVDIHDFRQVVPGVRVLNCTQTDCLAELSSGGCFYYVRSAACYFHETGIPRECVATGMNAAGDRLPCLNERSAAFERSVELQPVAVRTIDIRATFADRTPNYPEKAEVGLFLVRPTQLPTR